MLNLNEAEKQKNFDPIPDGTFLKLMLQFKAGGASFQGCEAADNGLFKNSKTSDAVLLECEFTVISKGPYEHRKWTEHMTVTGGSVDDKGNSKGGNMTRQRIRAMIESASNIRPDDESPEAKAGRMIPNYGALDEIPFYAKVRIEEGEDYTDQTTGEMKKGFDKNVIDRIVTPDMEEYAPLVRGEIVPPKPSGGRSKAKAAAGAGADAAAPRWKKDGAPAATEGPHNPAPAAAGAAETNKPKWLR